MNRNVVGIDLSLTATGIALSDGTYTIKSKPMDDRLERVKRIWDEVYKYLSSPDIIVLEHYSFGSKGRAVFDIAEMGGIVRWELSGRGYPVAEVSPSSLKLYGAGKGNADKIAMAVSASKRAGMEFPNDNECDAWWLRQMGLAYYGGAVPVQVPERHKEALAAVDWPRV